MRRKAIVSACLMAMAIIADAQTYTLRKCLETGLENNYSLRIVRNEEQIARNNATLANAGYLPTVDLNAGYKGAGSSSDSKVRSTGEIQEVRNSLDHTLNAGIGLNWTIFDGFKISTNYKQLKEMERMGETATRIAIEDFMAGLAAEYYNFLHQRLRLANYYYAVKLSKERLRIVEERYNIGNFSRLDYQQAKVDFNADSAQYMKQQELLHTSRIQLNELMANENVDQPIHTQDSLIDVNATLEFEELWNATMQTNANLLKAEQNKKQRIATIEENIAKLLVEKQQLQSKKEAKLEQIKEIQEEANYFDIQIKDKEKDIQDLEREKYELTGTHYQTYPQTPTWFGGKTTGAFVIGVIATIFILILLLFITKIIGLQFYKIYG